MANKIDPDSIEAQIAALRNQAEALEANAKNNPSKVQNEIMNINQELLELQAEAELEQSAEANGDPTNGSEAQKQINDSGYAQQQSTQTSTDSLSGMKSLLMYNMKC